MSKSEFWLVDFEATQISKSGGNWTDNSAFMQAVEKFLSDPAFVKYRSDIKIDKEKRRITAIKMIMRIRQVIVSLRLLNFGHGLVK